MAVDGKSLSLAVPALRIRRSMFRPSADPGHFFAPLIRQIQKAVPGSISSMVRRAVRTIRRNWAKNHRHQGGLAAVGRCLFGQLALQIGLAQRRPSVTAQLDCLTFSVVPWLTALWARLLSSSLSPDGTRLLIGDCSGGFGLPQRALIDNRARVLPCLNYHHGEKLDLFFRRICRAEFVLVCDDDVFWLSDRPWRWARRRFAENPRVAVVSFAPRSRVSSVLQGRVHEPMGSSCLIVRRQLWIEEGLCFRVRPATDSSSDWFYDTGDWANEELLKRGYRVEIAPPDVRADLVVLDAVSAWLLKLQKHPPETIPAVADIPLKAEKATRAVFVARGLAEILAELVPRQRPPSLIEEARLKTAESILERAFSREIRDRVAREVSVVLDRIRTRLAALGLAVDKER